MFQAIEDVSKGLKTLKLENPRTKEYVRMAPGFGANVSQIALAKNGALYTLLSGCETMRDFSGGNLFKGAKLIPFPNRLKNGAYSFENKKYQLELNYPQENNACHGFIYDKPFKVEKLEAGPGRCLARLAYDYSGFLPGYPFKCAISVEYSLDEKDSFKCRTEIKNLDNKAMPVGDGWHPFFATGSRVDELFLEFPAEKKIIVDERLIPTGEIKDYDGFNAPKQVGSTSFDTCFRLRPPKGDMHIVELHDKAKDIIIQLWMEAGKSKYSYLQVYTPSDRQAIAIEPMTCNIDAFNNLEGLIILRPGESFAGSYGVKLL